MAHEFQRPIKIAGCMVDFASQTITPPNGKPIHLAPSEFRAFGILCEGRHTTKELAVEFAMRSAFDYGLDNGHDIAVTPDIVATATTAVRRLRQRVGKEHVGKANNRVYSLLPWGG